MTEIVERLRQPLGSNPDWSLKNGCVVFAYDVDRAEAADEIERLNAWADGFSDAQLKERRLCEARIQEMQRQIDKLTLALMMIREGCAEPAKFAGERLAALSAAGERGGA